jgi:hypothetical protein
MSDRLTLTRALEGSGMASQAAERVATEIYDAIHATVATKTDIGLVQADIAALRADMHSEIAALRAEMRSEIAALRAEMHSEIAALRAEFGKTLAELEIKLTIRAAIIAALGLSVLFAALHLWPPHP